MSFAPGFAPKLAKRARLRFDRHSGRHMIVYPERGLVLNASAAAIAERCDGSRTVSQIVDELEADAPRSEVERDVLEFVALLATKGLLEP